MKKYIIILTLISSIVSYSQKITRGPDIGEIYFIGTTYDGTGLYYSTDFGETATCVDSQNFITSIAADKTPGGIYSVTMPVNLYHSDNYGYPNSWIFRTGEFDDNIKSGVSEGYLFSGCVLHSEDYGVNFFYHSLNGFFGNPKNNAIDNEDDNIGYVMVNKLTVADTLYLLRTYDKFENLEVIQKLHFPNGEITYLSRGYNNGELLLYYKLSNILNFSSDFAETFNTIDYFNFHNYYSIGIMGGRQTGEIYILYNFVNQMWLNAQTYIYHSTDHGNTFEVFHPFSKGNEPVLANFSTVDKGVLLATPIEFSNFSIGVITEYQWDFENDGIIDSYEEFPTHIYQDTGYYSVKLSVVGQDSTNTFIKENYIHVIDTLTSNPDLISQKFNTFPNPFNDKISIETRANFKMIEIYDLNGKSHCTKTLHQENKTEIIDLNNLKKGIYILKIKTERQDITKKIIKI